MGIPVLVLGYSGSGKSCSLRNFDEKSLAVINVASKPLPFRNKIPTVNLNKKTLTRVVKEGGKEKTIYFTRYDCVKSILKDNSKKCYVIDDSQYLMAFENMDKCDEIGYKKFTQFAKNFNSIIEAIRDDTDDDTIVYLLHHPRIDEAEGILKPKTIGKMLDDQIVVEGLFTIVLFARTDGERYWFETQNRGNTVAKTPMGMFDGDIDNDLAVVDATIREYYGMKKGDKE